MDWWLIVGGIFFIAMTPVHFWERRRVERQGKDMERFDARANRPVARFARWVMPVVGFIWLVVGLKA